MNNIRLGEMERHIIRHGLHREMIKHCENFLFEHWLPAASNGLLRLYSAKQAKSVLDLDDGLLVVSYEAVKGPEQDPSNESCPVASRIPVIKVHHGVASLGVLSYSDLPVTDDILHLGTFRVRVGGARAPALLLQRLVQRTEGDDGMPNSRLVVTLLQHTPSPEGIVKIPTQLSRRTAPEKVKVKNFDPLQRNIGRRPVRGWRGGTRRHGRCCRRPPKGLVLLPAVGPARRQNNLLCGKRSTGGGNWHLASWLQRHLLKRTRGYPDFLRR